MKADSSYIWVTFQKEGIHRYPAAETDPRLKTGGPDDVSFLAYPHRHIFHFRVDIEVFHDDRDLEFIQEKRFMQGLYDQGILNIDFMSCEMLANELFHKHLKQRYLSRPRRVVIEVSEDNENGCRMYYDIKEYYL